MTVLVFVLWNFMLLALLLIVPYENFSLSNSYHLGTYFVASTTLFILIAVGKRIQKYIYILWLPLVVIVFKYAVMNYGNFEYSEYSFGYGLWVKSTPTLLGFGVEYVGTLVPILVFEAVQYAVCE